MTEQGGNLGRNLPIATHQGILTAEAVVSRPDIVGRAHELIAAREASFVVEPLTVQERQDNVRTDVWERLTAAGHLSRVEIEGTLEEINRAVLTRLLNGWNLALHPHEKARRFAELCEELTIQEVHQGIIEGRLSAQTVVGTISDYPSTLDDNTANSLGYRASNRKGWNRSTSLLQLGDGRYKRVIESVSRSKSDQGSTDSFFEAAGIMRLGSESDTADVRALSTQFIYDLDDHPGGVVDIQRLLDAHAGPDIRYGEPINPQTVPYQHLRLESQAREQQVAHVIQELADYDARLEAAELQGQLTRTQRTDLYHEQLRYYLRAMCRVYPEYAEQCFGQAAGNSYREAAELMAAGQHQQAVIRFRQAETEEQISVACGGALKPKDRTDAEQLLGLGVNADTEALANEVQKTWHGGTIHRHKQCNCCKRVKAEVGACYICEECVANPRRMQDAYEADMRKSKVTKATLPAGNLGVAELVDAFLGRPGQQVATGKA